MSGSTASLPITVPRASIDEVRGVLAGWNGVTGAKIIGETEREIGLSVALLMTPLSAQMMRGELEKRLKPFGGKIGARDEWLLQKQAKDWL